MPPAAETLCATAAATTTTTTAATTTTAQASPSKVRPYFECGQSHRASPSTEARRQFISGSLRILPAAVPLQRRVRGRNGRYHQCAWPIPFAPAHHDGDWRALEAGRKGRIRWCFGEQAESPRQIAFRACGRWLRSLRHATTVWVSTGNSEACYREDVLWCTFLHGHFELMAESSGDSFATHLLFGTSRVLSLLELEPTRPLSLSRPTKSLADAFATLESHRAILYGDKATLAPAGDQPCLLQPDARGREILGLMVQTSNFAKRQVHPSSKSLQEIWAYDGGLAT
ncbi:uncharacterized protein BO66DRAFT_444702 [Aspergillus aculeatinus CBS 121060]|uniref:Uncharacterized protein n=1 Tax=Aspergillus aculeatinus CBS 121060 TaxID=1448322 RepID=A0ACD1GR82_9EURO|nr:hypothetical protein BO66DRAFT_444702 [Aspergillus aculeatinus CBS 121060]RAH63719.1 hypothetical protein BO66DRAFT_444702 [Aspergillus aculeatinus CBS 121060]